MKLKVLLVLYFCETKYWYNYCNEISFSYWRHSFTPLWPTKTVVCRKITLREKGSYIWLTTAPGRQSCARTSVGIAEFANKWFLSGSWQQSDKKAVNLLQGEVEMLFFGTTDKVWLPWEEIWILGWQRHLIFLTVSIKHPSRIGDWSRYMKGKNFCIALTMAKEPQLIIEQNLEHHAFELFL